MVKAAATRIPVVWKTKKSVADRLLGEAARSLLDDVLVLAQTTAAKRRWPLQKLKVEHYQDPEIVWEYMLVTLDFDCPRPKAYRLFSNFLKEIVAVEEGLEDEAREIFMKSIWFDLESDP